MTEKLELTEERYQKFLEHAKEITKNIKSEIKKLKKRDDADESHVQYGLYIAEFGLKKAKEVVELLSQQTSTKEERVKQLREAIMKWAEVPGVTDDEEEARTRHAFRSGYVKGAIYGLNKGWAIMKEKKDG